MSEQLDYIIVGQGIAGSMVAHFLLQKGKKILVIDQYNPTSSSNIAAGVVNPVTGRKMVKTWMIDDLLPFAKKTYSALEKQLQVSFFYENDIYKIFSSAEDIENWNLKKTETAYHDYLGDIVAASEINPHIKAPFGAGIIKQCCWMDVPVFTKAYRAFLLQHQQLIEEAFDFSELSITDEIHYKGYSAQNIIFCEGFKAYKNPLFSWIPFALAKGEQLLIQADELNLDKMLNRNIIIIPKGDNKYSVGSTFIWDDVEETVTEGGRTEILNKLNKVIDEPYQIVEEKAAIRPAMPDRRPVIGKHPKYKHVFIFNGMGTKGVSLSPYFANYFSDYLEQNFDIFKEISVNRF
jgi:glycine/D-amino acid oxidase-like deaminating enzyme